MPLKSFDDFVARELTVVVMTERIANLVALDYLHVVWDSAWGPHATG